ncbi:MATE family efflux transporter, partial [Mesorhizobium sp. M7A.F.Ca.CA.004.05.1.1]
MDQGATPADARSPINPGSFVVTNRSVLAIAVPMTLAYLTTPMLGLVDTAVI